MTKISNSDTISFKDTWWAQPVENLYPKFRSSHEGLTSAEAERRLSTYGPNLLFKKARSGPVKIFLNQFKSPIILMLLFATIISAFVGDLTDAIIILVIILGSAITSFVQEYR